MHEKITFWLQSNMKLIVCDKTKIQQKLIGSVSTLDEVLNRLKTYQEYFILFLMEMKYW